MNPIEDMASQDIGKEDNTTITEDSALGDAIIKDIQGNEFLDSDDKTL